VVSIWDIGSTSNNTSGTSLIIGKSSDDEASDDSLAKPPPDMFTVEIECAVVAFVGCIANRQFLLSENIFQHLFFGSS
jgi:hypothetical protein